MYFFLTNIRDWEGLTISCKFSVLLSTYKRYRTKQNVNASNVSVINSCEMSMSWQFNYTLLVNMNCEGGKTWRAYLVVNCSASSPHYTAVPEGKHDAPFRESMIAGYWLQIVLLLRGVSTRRKITMTEGFAVCLRICKIFYLALLHTLFILRNLQFSFLSYLIT